MSGLEPEADVPLALRSSLQRDPNGGSEISHVAGPGFEPAKG